MSNKKLDQVTIEKYQQQSKDELDRLYKDHKDELAVGGEMIEAKNLYPYVGSFSIVGIGYIRLFSVSPMAFTTGVNLTYSGEGGGVAFGGGVFAGGGIFRVDPASLHNKEVAFLVASTGGKLQITWILDGLPIGVFTGIGLAAFAGAGGGSGFFRRV